MRIALAVVLGVFAYSLRVAAEPSAPAQSFGVGAIGLQATEWRVTTHGIERGLMLGYGVSAVTSGSWWTMRGSQFLALGGGEGGFQAEYITRAAYGFRFLRSSHSAFVLRGGATIDAIGTPHGGATLQLGPLFDLGYQVLTRDGLLDFGVQTVIPVIPAVFWDNSSHHPGEWFSTGPRITAAFRSVYAEGSIARTERDAQLRTEFHFDLCASAGLVICARLHNFRFDDAKRPVTLMGLMVGFGSAGTPQRPAERRNDPERPLQAN